MPKKGYVTAKRRVDGPKKLEIWKCNSAASICAEGITKQKMKCFGQVLWEQGSRTRRRRIITKLSGDIPSSLDYQWQHLQPSSQHPWPVNYISNAQNSVRLSLLSHFRSNRGLLRRSLLLGNTDGLAGLSGGSLLWSSLCTSIGSRTLLGSGRCLRDGREDTGLGIAYIFALAEVDRGYAPSCISSSDGNFSISGLRTSGRASAFTSHCLLLAN